MLIWSIFLFLSLVSETIVHRFRSFSARVLSPFVVLRSCCLFPSGLSRLSFFRRIYHSFNASIRQDYRYQSHCYEDIAQFDVPRRFEDFFFPVRTMKP
ncbi:hypothetical protein CPB83DRAFT_852073 [Crepidotus variabilis]|uniref:Secreted protein n=1 Tax=Crepidotus variabilis TaxID=179855 RepID=A0A9P6EII3_9AGAR|nr:hypothetical protein CPB83DRAFT_852073 [Crepidotus variabilis]